MVGAAQQLCLAAAQPPWEDCLMLETSPLYHQLADQIHELIRAGTLRAGDRVPSVRRLSTQQRVSVSTVLQAYQRLEDIGVIEARPQSGYYVRRLSAGGAGARAVAPAEARAQRRGERSHRGGARATPPIRTWSRSARRAPRRSSSSSSACAACCRRSRAATATRSAATACRRAPSACAARSRAARSSGAAASTTAISSPRAAAWRRSTCACAR